jgi:hypothetical protein
VRKDLQVVWTASVASKRWEIFLVPANIKRRE